MENKIKKLILSWKLELAEYTALKLMYVSVEDWETVYKYRRLQIELGSRIIELEKILNKVC